MYLSFLNSHLRKGFPEMSNIFFDVKCRGFNVGHNETQPPKLTVKPLPGPVNDVLLQSHPGPGERIQLKSSLETQVFFFLSQHSGLIEKTHGSLFFMLNYCLIV